MITCVLKSSKEDLILPISSYNSRMKEKGCSLSVVVPNGIAYSDQLSERLNGYIELQYNGNTFAYSDSIVSAPLYIGATSSSIQISSKGDFPSVGTVNVDLSGVSFFTLNVDGKYRIRAKTDYSITPNSTVNYDGNSYVVETVSIYQSEDSGQMELLVNA